MATEVIVPDMGVKDVQGSIGIWFKEEGDVVQKGEVLCTIETEKASTDIESPCAGILRRILCPRDAVVSIQDCIAIIGDANEDITSLEEAYRKK